jgi:hypothetical protein
MSVLDNDNDTVRRMDGKTRVEWKWIRGQRVARPSRDFQGPTLANGLYSSLLKCIVIRSTAAGTRHTQT